jgi:acylpyruvate hydrolase
MRYSFRTTTAGAANDTLAKNPREHAMRFISFQSSQGFGVAVWTAAAEYRGLTVGESGFPGDLGHILLQGPDALRAAAEALRRGPLIDLSRIEYLPPVTKPGKIICIGLNYLDHSVETGLKVPDYPAVFVRFLSTLVGHMAPIVRPRLSEQLDYEGELVAVVGKAGRHISKQSALQHIAGYSLFNDASIRDYQFKSTQWTVGKNFDATGAFGSELISADELPPGCKGLHFETKLNGQIVQKAAIDDLIFDVATLVSVLSESMTLSPGDIIATGTPAGVGFTRKPPLWMKPGDVCVISSEQLGVLRNPIVAESA